MTVWVVTQAPSWGKPVSVFATLALAMDFMKQTEMSVRLDMELEELEVQGSQ